MSRKVAASGQGLRDLSTRAGSILYRRFMAIDARRSRWVALGLTWAAACGQVGDANESETVDAPTDATAGTSTNTTSDTADAPTTGSTGVPGTTDADETTSTTGPVATDTGPTSTGTTDTGEPPPVPVGTIAELLVPFDVNQEDLVGPSSWESQYGKPPEIVAVPLGAAIDVLVQDYAEGPDGHAYVLRLEPSADDYVITAVLEPAMLDKVMGLARDPDGQLYVASGVAEGDTLTLDDPQPGQHRGGIVRVVKQSWDGAVHFDTDVDLGREALAPDSEPIINPMVAGTARLAWGAGALALVHGNNTDTDWNIMARHQKALTTHLDAGSGAVTRTSSIWVSHSFDHRLFYDGTGFLELHLGDAFPRDVTFARVEPDSDPYSLLAIKGNTGNNNTFTRLGNAAPIEGDPIYGYLALFATESTTGTGDLVSGSRELAIVRVRRDFEAAPPDSGMHLDPACPTPSMSSRAASRGRTGCAGSPTIRARPAAPRTPSGPSWSPSATTPTSCCGSAGTARSRPSPGRGAWSSTPPASHWCRRRWSPTRTCPAATTPSRSPATPRGSPATRPPASSTSTSSTPSSATATWSSSEAENHHTCPNRHV
ncbi:hypothetical protein [Nannocystis pusilla]|uniref:hypothetical protein n=1 Tax=Nannocystis pusilla TaxID=889268 RepID=UPI003B77A7D4